MTAKNRAKNNAVITATESFRVTVYKYVSATIEPSKRNFIFFFELLDNPHRVLRQKINIPAYETVMDQNSGSDGIMTYHVDKTITCNVIGGFPPHKVDLILPNQGNLLFWQS